MSRPDNRGKKLCFSLRLETGPLGLLPWVGWDSSSVSLKVSIMAFSEDKELVSGADDTGKVSRYNC